MFDDFDGPLDAAATKLIGAQLTVATTAMELWATSLAKNPAYLDAAREMRSAADHLQAAVEAFTAAAEEGDG